MSDAKVVSLHSGQDVQHPTPNDSCVQTLEGLLDMARGGEIVGIAAACLHHDNCGSFRLSGAIGSYSMLGALVRVQQEVQELVQQNDESS